MTTQENDINQIISAAVNARVEAAVLEAMTSSNTMATFVQAALTRKVSSSGYSRDEKPLLTHLLQTTIEEQTKAVVAEEISKNKDVIRAEVQKALSKSIGVISDSLVDGFVSNAQGSYPSIKVQFGG